jgi:hypothetical protein
METKLNMNSSSTIKKYVVVGFLLSVMWVITSVQASAQEQQLLYPAKAPLSQYLSPDKQSEIALARSAAPTSISGDADVMVLEADGYTTAIKGANGFVCITERSWANATDSPEFWNPKLRSPNCFNAAAARSFLPIYLRKTKLVLAGKSKSDIAAAIAAGFDKKELPALEVGAMCYMMSKQQYLNDEGRSWHPHLMFLIAGDAAKAWGANLPDSPIMAAVDPEERVTIFMVLTGTWSDGTPAMH